MNKKLLLFFFIISLTSYGQTSVYHQFPDSNAVWNIEHVMWWGCGPPMYANKFELYSYQLNGDTTINSFQYHKVYIPFVQENCSGSSTSHYQTPGYKGCLREDTSARKVYFVYPNNSTDSLLYDFNLQVGDTLGGILSHTSLCLYHPLIINQIDSVLVNNTYRKQWNYLGPLQGSIVEGVGSLSGLLEVQCQYPDEPEAHLTCFKQDGIILYTSQWYLPFVNCNLIDGITNVSFDAPYAIFPNPATNEFTVYVLRFPISEIEIYNISGQKIFSQKPMANNQMQTIDVSSFTAGTYFVKMYSAQSVEVSKLIKQ